MYRRLSKAFYGLTILLFLIVFLYIYSTSPEFVTYELFDKGLPLKQFTKETFFYLFIGVFMFVNVLLMLPAKMIETHFSPMLRRVFPRGESFREQMLSLLYSFAAILNIATVTMVFYLHSITNQNEISILGWYAFVPPLLNFCIISLVPITSTTESTDVLDGRRQSCQKC